MRRQHHIRQERTKRSERNINMSDKKYHIETLAIHAGQKVERSDT